MKETLRLILVLTVTATLTGALLALANAMTREPIAAARRADLLNALNVVLPPHDNAPDRDQVAIEIDGTAWIFYPARLDGNFAGAAFTSDADGYGGRITVMIGVDAGNRIHAIRVLNQLETPGLGANIVQPRFTDQFAERSFTPETRLAVKQDGGDIEAITAATISSRAVAEAVADGLRRYQAHRERIAAGVEYGKEP